MLGSKWIINLLIVAFLVIMTGFFLPEDYEIERSVEINAPVDKVYAVIVDLHKWEQWSTWFQKDPNAIMTYEGPDRAIGMRANWQSDVIGQGSIEITSLQFNRQVVYSVDNPAKGVEADGDMRVRPTDSGTLLKWRTHGKVDLSLIDRYKLLFFDDKLGNDIQVGLENIKTLVENRLD